MKTKDPRLIKEKIKVLIPKKISPKNDVNIKVNIEKTFKVLLSSLLIIFDEDKCIPKDMKAIRGVDMLSKNENSPKSDLSRFFPRKLKTKKLNSRTNILEKMLREIF